MKVFLSWSGEKSHKVATIFREWLPSVIQSLYPYVSSEDIDKGARWSTDISKELADSTFGILCVTKENINAPWLNFEAGALSKTIDNTFVSPFLFDIKRSEVDGPILQFQSTIFEKDDILKLVRTINKASGEEILNDDRLTTTFNVWYPSLEKSLKEIQAVSPTNSEHSPATGSDKLILEEILELSRINQRLIRNPENDNSKKLEELKQLIEENNFLRLNTTRNLRRRNIQPNMIEEIYNIYPNDTYIGIQIILSFIKDDFPWIYNSGLETINILKYSHSRNEKQAALMAFNRVVEFTSEHPAMREFAMSNKSQYVLLKEIPFLFKRTISENSSLDKVGIFRPTDADE